MQLFEIMGYFILLFFSISYCYTLFYIFQAQAEKLLIEWKSAIEGQYF